MFSHKYLYISITLIIWTILLCVLYLFPNREWYVINQDGHILPATALEFGVDLERAKFISSFRRDLPQPMSENIRDELRDRLINDYANDAHLLNKWHNFSSDRERFIAYLMLRVNGSLPIYAVKSIHDDLEDILFSREGNCAHQALRLLMILDLFSIKGEMISWWSHSIEGHVFVDAFDPIEKRSYFLDSTSNLMASEKIDTTSGFIDVLSQISPKSRKDFINSRMKEFPNFVSRFTGVDQSFRDWSLNNYLRSKDSTITGLSYELPIAIDRWKNGANRPPENLCQFASRRSESMQKFSTQSCSNS